jgi:ubiquinone/menaquinone biosynthesis C-methylase UbiE
MSATGEPANWHLKDEIRAYWSKRAATFDQSFGHRILPGPEHDAWAEVLRCHLGHKPLHVLELACGTGEVTRILRALGHQVTGVDFSDAMIAHARAKHAGDPGARFVLADAENTMEPEGAYEAVVCRHLVWTLTDPKAALHDWFRVLRSGGCLVVFDGNFVTPSWTGRVARHLLAVLEARGAPAHRDPALTREHEAILHRLPFRTGLDFATLRPLAENAGFRDVVCASYRPILRAQRQIAAPQDWLRTWLHRRFILVARKA